MHARVITFQVQPARLEEIVGFFEACVVPEAEQQAGFEGLLIFTDETAGKAVSITFWRTRSEMAAFDTDCLARLAADFSLLLDRAPAVEVYALRVRADARAVLPVLHFAETSLGIRIAEP